MVGDECGNLLDPVVSGKKGPEPHGPVQGTVQLVNIRYVIHLGQGEELPVELFRRHRTIISRYGSSPG